MMECVICDVPEALVIILRTFDWYLDVRSDAQSSYVIFNALDILLYKKIIFLLMEMYSYTRERACTYV